jgi:hypothetical protein
VFVRNYFGRCARAYRVVTAVGDVREGVQWECREIGRVRSLVPLF